MKRNIIALLSAALIALLLSSPGTSAQLPGCVVDDNFSPSADKAVLALAVQPDGKILVGGRFTSLNGRPRSRIGRLNGDGTLDLNFDPQASDWVSSIALLPDDKVMLGGGFNWVGSHSAHQTTPVRDQSRCRTRRTSVKEFSCPPALATARPCPPPPCRGRDLA
jgi:hypothetical protein